MIYLIKDTFGRRRSMRFRLFQAEVRDVPYETFRKIRDRREVIMKHIRTLNTQILQNTVKKGGCGGVPDVLPVCLQDILHRRQSDV